MTTSLPTRRTSTVTSSILLRWTPFPTGTFAAIHWRHQKRPRCHQQQQPILHQSLAEKRELGLKMWLANSFLMKTTSCVESAMNMIPPIQTGLPKRRKVTRLIGWDATVRAGSTSTARTSRGLQPCFRAGVSKWSVWVVGFCPNPREQRWQENQPNLRWTMMSIWLLFTAEAFQWSLRNFLASK